MTKKELRKNVLKERGKLSVQSLAEKSSIITKRIFELEEYRSAKSIMTYVDFRNEVQTGEFIRTAMAEGKEVAVPLTDLEGKRLIPSLLQYYPGDLTAGTYGILEPRADRLRRVEPDKFDLVVVPGVAFDNQGNRLGYGGGFYDRFLIKTREDCVWLAPAFELQICSNVYHDEHDCPVHIIVTENKVINLLNK